MWHLYFETVSRKEKQKKKNWTKKKNVFFQINIYFFSILIVSTTALSTTGTTQTLSKSFQLLQKLLLATPSSCWLKTCWEQEQVFPRKWKEMSICKCSLCLETVKKELSLSIFTCWTNQDLSFPKAFPPEDYLILWKQHQFDLELKIKCIYLYIMK